MPQRLPDSLKQLRGTARPCRLGTPESEPVPLTDTSPPDWLTESQRARWQHFIAILLPTGLLGNADRDALAAMAVLQDLLTMVERIVIQEGMLVTVRGQQVTHPAQKAAHRLSHQLLALYKSFGMTPASRRKL